MRRTNTNLLSKVATSIGSLIWIATAAFHTTGFSSAVDLQSELEQDSFVGNAIPILWLSPAVHWIGLAIVVTGVSFSSGTTGLRRFVLVVAIAILSIDAIGIYSAVGLFSGIWLLATTAVLYGVALGVTKAQRDAARCKPAPRSAS